MNSASNVALILSVKIVGGVTAGFLVKYLTWYIKNRKTVSLDGQEYDCEWTDEESGTTYFDTVKISNKWYGSFAGEGTIKNEKDEYKKYMLKGKRHDDGEISFTFYGVKKRKADQTFGYIIFNTSKKRTGVLTGKWIQINSQSKIIGGKVVWNERNTI